VERPALDGVDAEENQDEPVALAKAGRLGAEKELKNPVEAVPERRVEKNEGAEEEEEGAEEKRLEMERRPNRSVRDGAALDALLVDIPLLFPSLFQFRDVM